MLRDTSVDLTEDMARELAEDVRTNPLFAGGMAWTINAYSGLLMRDDIHFHENWMFRADPDWPDVHPEVPFPEWRIDQRVDGATNRSFVDGDPR